MGASPVACRGGGFEFVVHAVVIRAVGIAKLGSRIGSQCGDVLMRMAIAGASAVGRGSRRNVFSLYNACRGGACSEGHASTVGVHSRSNVLALITSADGERSAGAVVGSARRGSR